MNGLALKRFTAFAYGHDNPAPEVWVNPAQIAYVQPRVVTRGKSRDCTEGTLLYFQQVDNTGVVAVREDIGYVVAVLQSGRGGVCRDCYEILDEAWRSLCSDCCQNRHRGVDADPEEAVA